MLRNENAKDLGEGRSGSSGNRIGLPIGTKVVVENVPRPRRVYTLLETSSKLGSIAVSVHENNEEKKKRKGRRGRCCFCFLVTPTNVGFILILYDNQSDQLALCKMLVQC